MSDHAVFFDPSRRRWWWVKRLGTLLGLVVVVTISAWLLSLFTAPLLPGMPGITTAIVRSLKRSVHFPRHQTRAQQFLAKGERNRLLTAIANDKRRRLEWLAKNPVSKTEAGNGIVAAFYAPWQETGLHSLRDSASQMTHLLPVWVHLQADANGLDFHDWDPVLTPHNLEVLAEARKNNLNVLPVFSNAQISTTGSGEFDAKRVHIFLNSPPLQLRTIMILRQWCQANRFQGINVWANWIHYLRTRERVTALVPRCCSAARARRGGACSPSTQTVWRWRLR